MIIDDDILKNISIYINQFFIHLKIDFKTNLNKNYYNYYLWNQITI
jgi:hypothetical protein